jgi:hypothetical protein
VPVSCHHSTTPVAATRHRITLSLFEFTEQLPAAPRMTDIEHAVTSSVLLDINPAISKYAAHDLFTGSS